MAAAIFSLFTFHFSLYFVPLHHKKRKTMEKKDDNTLMKARSYRGILAEGYRLYNGNFRKLFKASWLMALIYAIVGAAMGSIGTVQLPNMMALIITLVVLILLTITTEALATATILNKLKEHQDTDAITTPSSWWKPDSTLMGRTLKAVVFALPLCIILTIIFPLVLPINFVVMKYVMTPGHSFWPSLWSDYKRGLRYWGSTFLVLFVSVLLIVMVSIVVLTPSVILTLANMQAQQSVLMGDPSGMPSYILPLTFATLALTNFIEYYVVLVVVVHFYYIYGSIETKELEREQQKQDIK